MTFVHRKKAHVSALLYFKVLLKICLQFVNKLGTLNFQKYFKSKFVDLHTRNLRGLVPFSRNLTIIFLIPTKIFTFNILRSSFHYYSATLEVRVAKLIHRFLCLCLSGTGRRKGVVKFLFHTCLVVTRKNEKEIHPDCHIY